jgi:hypothetical protein
VIEDGCWGRDRLLHLDRKGYKYLVERQLVQSRIAFGQSGQGNAVENALDLPPIACLVVECRHLD